MNDVIAQSNLAAFAWLNANPGLQGMALAAALAAAVWLIYLVPAGLAGLWWCGDAARRQAAVEALMATLCALAMNKLIGTLWYHARPFAAGVGNNYLWHAPTSSFPSNHATIMLTVGLVLATCGVSAARQLGLALLPAAAIVAWARVFVGVHWPLDMAGAAIMAASMCLMIRTPFARRGTGLVTQWLTGLARVPRWR